MIKLTNTLLIGLIASSLLVGCSDGDDGTVASAPTQTPAPTTTSATPPAATPPATTPATPSAKTFGANVMPILNAKCKVCHGSNGRFTITTTSSTYNNIVALKGSATAGGQYLLDKGSNAIGHGGGQVITTSSAEYATIKSWVDAGAANN